MAEATRYQKLISGLLGEDISGMSEEERKKLSREGTIAALAGVLGGSGLLGGLAGYGQNRAQQRAQAEVARRTAAATAEMPRITGRLLGGTAGALESLPGGEGGPLTARYRQTPQEALARLYGTQAGRDVAQVAPDLAKLATEGTLGRTVGGSVYNPLTGGFSRPPEAQVETLPAAEVARLGLPAGTLVQRDPSGELKILREPPRIAMGGASGGGSGGAAGSGTPGAGARYRNMTEEEVASAGFPKGTVVQLDTQTGAMKPLSTVPAAQRTTEAGKATSVTRVDTIADRISKQMDEVSTGGPLGLTGALSRIFDSQDAKLFETYRQQLSTALRAALRIPGEGALSDRDLALYGLTLPELGQSRKNNLAILESLKQQVRLAAGQEAATSPAAAAPAASQYIYRNGRLVPAASR